MLHPTPSRAAARPSEALRTARFLTWLILPLAALASAGGLFLPELYREPAAVAAVTRSQDLITLLIVLPSLAGALLLQRRESASASMLWLGLLGYLLYTYIGLAFVYTFNEFFLLYVALFALSLFALGAAVSGINAEGLKERFPAGARQWPVVLFLLLVSFILVMGEGGQVIGFFATGEAPALIPGTDAPPNYVFALDLGVVVPLMVMAALWLRRGRAWGYLLAGAMLVKAATMGLALLAMTYVGKQAGLETDPGLTTIWVAIAGGGGGLAFWFFRQGRGRVDKAA